ncbi:MAG: MFS transporter [Deltaproteobacteria bacterium]|jgi:FSR family fosmidomycin resistance protein-like MFS transporter|nr:MFS transporter [Deltaproteobacteria bacterium]
MKTSKYSLMTMLGHISTDINQGALPALLPFLVLNKDISYTSAAGLIFAANSVSSFVQPLLGYLGDKVSWTWLMGLGIFLAGAGIAAVGWLDGYWAIFFAVMVSGVGVAIFHPEGGKIANLVAGEKKGAGIAIFSVGGNIGFALGPVIVSLAISLFGMKGTAVFLAPAVLMPLVVLANLKALNRITAESRTRQSGGRENETADDWPSFFKAASCITARSIVAYGLTTFIPLYFAVVLLMPEASASTTLTLFSVAAAAATLCGGHVADRVGFNRIIRVCFSLLVPLLLLFPLIGNVYLAVVLLVPIAFMLNAPQSASIALGQKFVPNHIGTSSGIMLGMAVSVGGMVAPGIGWVGDHYGLTAAIYTVAGFAVLVMGLAFLIPDPRKFGNMSRARKAGEQKNH